MFGYIRPVTGELLVKEADFYNAVYCGLCRYSGKHLSHISRFLLNYDFTFLAVLRLALTKETVTVEKKRCPYKCRKKATVCCDAVFAYTAEAFGLFAYHKLQDDLRDQKGFARFGKRLVLPWFAHVRRKCRTFADMEQLIALPIQDLHKLEEAHCDSPDRAADCFGRIMRDVAAFGLDGTQKAIAEQCGYHIGRFIYLIDAYDDFEKDAKSGNYNPFLAKYGDADGVRTHANEIRTTLIDSMNVFSHSFALSCGPVLNGLERTVFNICELGSKAAIERVEQKASKGTKRHV